MIYLLIWVLCPKIFFVAGLSVLMSYFMGGSTIKVTDTHKVSITLWFLVIAISSARKGAAHTTIHAILKAVRPYYRTHLGMFAFCDIIMHNIKIFRIIKGNHWQFTLDNGTIPAILKLFRDNKETMLIEYEEIGEFIKTFELEDKHGLRAKLLSIHDCKPWQHQYKNGPTIAVEKPKAPMFVGAQHTYALMIICMLMMIKPMKQQQLHSKVMRMVLRLILRVMMQL